MSANMDAELEEIFSLLEKYASHNFHLGMIRYCEDHNIPHMDDYTEELLSIMKEGNVIKYKITNLLAVWSDK